MSNIREVSMACPLASVRCDAPLHNTVFQVHMLHSIHMTKAKSASTSRLILHYQEWHTLFHALRMPLSRESCLLTCHPGTAEIMGVFVRAAPDQVIVSATSQTANAAGTRNLLQAPAAAPSVYTIQVCCSGTFCGVCHSWRDLNLLRLANDLYQAWTL